MNNIYNPYQQAFASPRQNMLPPQQILQANGKTSIDMIQMSPNSSVLIADTTAPIVWKCVSDGLGNVTAEPFDIIPHKDEVQVEQETIVTTLTQMNARLTHLEELINEQSIVSTNSDGAEFVTNNAGSKKRTKPAGSPKPNGAE